MTVKHTVKYHSKQNESNGVVFNYWVSKIIHVCYGFALLHSVSGWQNSCPFLSQLCWSKTKTNLEFPVLGVSCKKFLQLLIASLSCINPSLVIALLLWYLLIKTTCIDVYDISFHRFFLCFKSGNTASRTDLHKPRMVLLLFKYIWLGNTGNYSTFLTR